MGTTAKLEKANEYTQRCTQCIARDENAFLSNTMTANIIHKLR